jgi:hypothetical protein
MHIHVYKYNAYMRQSRYSTDMNNLDHSHSKEDLAWNVHEGGVHCVPIPAGYSQFCDAGSLENLLF